MEDLLVAHRILVFQFATEDVGEDLELSVSMGSKSLAGSDLVLVDDSQRTEGIEAVIVVVGEIKRVIGIQPSVVGVSSNPRIF